MVVAAVAPATGMRQTNNDVKTKVPRLAFEDKEAKQILQRETSWL